MIEFIKKIFHRGGYELTLNRVHDTVRIRENNDSITLQVNGDAMRMVAGLNKAQAKMKELSDDSTEEQIKETAEYFATVIFGQEQARQLMDFYANDPACVITACGNYFKERLAKRITDIQKKLRV